MFRSNYTLVKLTYLQNHAVITTKDMQAKITLIQQFCRVLSHKDMLAKTTLIQQFCRVLSHKYMLGKAMLIQQIRRVLSLNADPVVQCQRLKKILPLAPYFSNQ